MKEKYISEIIGIIDKLSEKQLIYLLTLIKKIF